MTLAEVRRLVAFDRVANDLTLASLSASSPPRAIAVMAHIVGAERLWLARMAAEPSPLAVWPELDLDGIRRELTAVEIPWNDFLGTLDTKGLEREVSYTNSQGQSFVNRVDDILQHVFFHSTYHRGQIAAAVRAAGGTPAYTDFIQIVRSGLIPPTPR
jgi:uncharacterized damage-inducible protein DinB